MHCYPQSNKEKRSQSCRHRSSVCRHIPCLPENSQKKEASRVVTSPVICQAAKQNPVSTHNLIVSTHIR
ncbi:hypothetical protein Taro_015032 [Colocasia esculenta]|uniref:Uncharacterized protein n=1 Tax=Colocasia esculenta TaxID=4460 RepID=A0A843UGH5_COLES|nr:hypothetical protein [Colocasia esculenta]